MLRSMLGFTLLFYGSFANSQVEFVKLADFSNRYHQDSDLSKLNREYDLLFILLLDTTFKELFKNQYPEIVDMYNFIVDENKLGEMDIVVETDKTSINEVFDHPVFLLDIVFEQDTFYSSRYCRIIEPVYASTDFAILEASCSSFIVVYWVGLRNSYLEFQFLYSTKEVPPAGGFQAGYTQDVYLKWESSCGQDTKHVLFNESQNPSGCSWRPEHLDDYLSETKDILIYPNPAEGFITMEGSPQHEYTYSIYDVFGRLMVSDVFVNTTTVNTSGFSKGVYVVLIHDVQYASATRIKLSVH